MYSDLNEIGRKSLGHSRGHEDCQLGRTYRRTHPWLNYGLDLRPANRQLWLSLGEAQSKCQHLAGAPLRPDVADRIYRMYLAKGVLATTAIEGNTLSEQEVMAHLDGKLQLPPSREYLRQEIDNILEIGNEMLADIVEERHQPFTVDLIKHFNRAVLKNLTVDEDTIPGEIRKDIRVVGRYRCAPPEDCEFLLEKLCEWLESEDLKLEPGNEIVCGIIRAIVAHIYFVWIHPFGDGNGRTARLIEVKLLLDAGVPSDAAHLLSNYYNKTRSEYYRQLDAASKSGGNILPFIEYAVTGIVEELREQIGIVREQHIDVTWINYVHEKFEEKKSHADRRRRLVVLAINGVVKIASIPKLTPEIAAEYAGKTTKTVIRDINSLVEMGLIQRVRGGAIRIKKETILAFLPTRKRENDE